MQCHRVCCVFIEKGGPGLTSRLDKELGTGLMRSLLDGIESPYEVGPAAAPRRLRERQVLGVDPSSRR